jgi:transposase
MVKVNPRQARRFAEASGQLAKTDRCDAAMLARMGSALELEPRPVVSQTTDELKELLGARDALIKDRVAALNRRKTALSALIKRQLAQRLRQIDAQIGAIDQQQKKLRSADSNVQERYQILTSIPGVGDVTANVLIVEMPELGQLEQGQVASLAGLAPIANDSGKSSAKRSIRGGRSRARQALYMPALNAVRFYPHCKAKYDAMIKAGKPKKGRSRCNHAKARGPRQRPSPRQPKMVPPKGLTTTDTTIARAAARLSSQWRARSRPSPWSRRSGSRSRSIAARPPSIQTCGARR